MSKEKVEVVKDGKAVQISINSNNVYADGSQVTRVGDNVSANECIGNLLELFASNDSVTINVDSNNNYFPGDSEEQDLDPVLATMPQLGESDSELSDTQDSGSQTKSSAIGLGEQDEFDSNPIPNLQEDLGLTISGDMGKDWMQDSWT